MSRVALAGAIAAHGLIHLIGFVVAAEGIVRRSTWALPLTAILAIVSLMVCLVGLPETAMGIAVNMAILGGVAWVARSRTHTVEVTS